MSLAVTISNFSKGLGHTLMNANMLEMVGVSQSKDNL
jgi:hypothetical protein